MPSETKKALIVVRTYPTPAKKGIEVSCTAAITHDGKWLRLFPVPYRFLDHDKRFRKYQWIEVGVEKASDARPESYKLVPDSIQIKSDPLPTADAWKLRRQIVLPLKRHCLCCIKKELDDNGSPTLGVFRPKEIKRLVIQADDDTWSEEQLQLLRQQNLFGSGPQVELEKVPFKFSYEFTCEHSSCNGHTLSCTDWEMGESWRRWRQQYGEAGWESRFREKYERTMIHERDTYFYVGTVHQHPKSWIIVGLFYPPHSLTEDLFESDERTDE